MNIKDYVGKFIRFTKRIEEQEGLFEAGMLAKVISVTDGGCDNLFELICDFSMFEVYNRQFAHPNYYDKTGAPTLFVWETDQYPNCLWEIVYADDTPIEFELVPDEEGRKIADTVILNITRTDLALLRFLTEEGLDAISGYFNKTNPTMIEGKRILKLLKEA